ncbi:TolC family protein [Draconibacterium sp. IB214405]|uniref:TolC family protein n=1 Tax=Draconibacterium sp. IB214405 TaxID=3097352 RepID=UPI002A0CE5AB|nr:TolC family protein [Draconibacterium sp. IB214405]MDX8338977.1 TolC family protein [Draconibacterium sp. IB214405]
MNRIKTIIFFLAVSLPTLLFAQNETANKTWSLTDCIDYALEQNIQVRQSILSNLSNEVNKEQAEAQLLPSLNASARQNFSWSKVEDYTTGESSFEGSNSRSMSLNSSITIYNGLRLKNLIKQAELDLQAGLYDSETIKESITISILNAFLQVVAYEENVKNAQSQMEATSDQLVLSDARLQSGIISRSDYLQVKSQLATEKLSLANAQSQYAISKISLMQLMELPVDENFAIERPVLDGNMNQNLTPKAAEVYAIALGIKPQIKSAEYQKESAALNEKIARGNYYPSVAANAGLSSGFSSSMGQLGDQVTPTVGLSVSIPIFQNKQVKSSVANAKINYQNAELSEINTRNELRKEIEQACVDVSSAQIQYEASLESYNSYEESYALAEEKFNNGLINSVDFLFEKTNLIAAESDLLQSKFNLIFSYKILDYYQGTPIAF